MALRAYNQLLCKRLHGHFEFNLIWAKLTRGRLPLVTVLIRHVSHIGVAALDLLFDFLLELKTYFFLKSKEWIFVVVARGKRGESFGRAKYSKLLITICNVTRRYYTKMKRLCWMESLLMTEYIFCYYDTLIQTLYEFNITILSDIQNIMLNWTLWVVIATKYILASFKQQTFY